MKYEVKCSFCGKHKFVYAYQLKEDKLFFCNNSCHGKWRIGNRNYNFEKHFSEKTKKKISNSRYEFKKKLGYINSPETRKKISNALKGRILSKEHIKHISKSNKSKKKPPFTEEHKRKLSESGKYPRPWLRGKNSNFWKGGKTKLIKLIKASYNYKKWRNDIFIRDIFTCQECGKGGNNLQPHHKIPISIIIKDNNIENMDDARKCEELWNINNGITLCKTCHKKTDSYGFNFFKHYKDRILYDVSDNGCVQSKTKGIQNSSKDKKEASK